MRISDKIAEHLKSCDQGEESGQGLAILIDGLQEEAGLHGHFFPRRASRPTVCNDPKSVIHPRRNSTEVAVERHWAC